MRTSLRRNLNDPAIYTPLLITLLAALLHLYDLADIFFWYDEGETLVLGKSILLSGLPHIDLGSFRICPSVKSLESGIWIIHPWLQFYITALSIFLFDKSIFFLRLPFACAGIACIPLLWNLGLRFKLERKILTIACLLLATNVSFTVLSRNVRYYSLAPFFTLLLLIYYCDLRSGLRKIWPRFCFVAILLVHTIHPVGFAVLIALFCHAVVFERKKPFLTKLLISNGITLATILPFLILSLHNLRQYYSAYDEGYQNPYLIHGLTATAAHLLHLIKFNFPTLLLILLLFPLWKKRSPRVLTNEPFILLAMVTGMICLTMGNVLYETTSPAYVVAALPLVVLLSACLIYKVSLGYDVLVFGLIGVVIWTNALNLPYWPSHKKFERSFVFASKEDRPRFLWRSLVNRQIRTPLKDYLVELTTEYQGPVEGIVRFLQENAQSQDTFFTTRDTETIHFMTELSRIDTLPFPSPPTWIIRRVRHPWRRAICNGGGLTDEEIDKYLLEYLQSHHYEIITLDYPDTAEENMPFVPFHHRWQTATNKPRVTIFHYPKKASPQG